MEQFRKEKGEVLHLHLAFTAIAYPGRRREDQGRTSTRSLEITKGRNEDHHRHSIHLLRRLVDPRRIHPGIPRRCLLAARRIREALSCHRANRARVAEERTMAAAEVDAAIVLAALDAVETVHAGNAAALACHHHHHHAAPPSFRWDTARRRRDVACGRCMESMRLRRMLVTLLCFLAYVSAPKPPNFALHTSYTCNF
uniref:Uncharacterized protein n=1 Tax=Leersia perrieri TaxID=77586 RepID=A0A0D9XBT8_9ORYZ